MVDLNVSSNCWICEGWSRIEFAITKDRVNQASNNVRAKGVYLHLSFEGFQEHQIPEMGDSYRAYRMVPPGRHSYFYSVSTAGGGKELKSMVDGGSPVIRNSQKVM